MSQRALNRSRYCRAGFGKTRVNKHSEMCVYVRVCTTCARAREPEVRILVEGEIVTGLRYVLKPAPAPPASLLSESALARQSSSLAPPISSVTERSLPCTAVNVVNSCPFIHFVREFNYKLGRNSSVGIATRCGLEGPGIESR
jgi:hypothetical protein